jgi:hypothetical protein
MLHISKRLFLQQPLLIYEEMNLEVIKKGINA